MEAIIIIVIIVLSFLFRQFLNSNSKMKKYHNISIDLLILGCLVLFAVGINYLNNQISKYSSSLVEADGFTIDSYNVKMDVSENSVVNVTEKITVNFYENGHHGIYRFIPSWLEYTPKEGNTISRKSKIIDLKALGDEYSLDIISGKDRIKIGSPDYTLPIGPKTYTITYQYDMGNDPFEKFDEFIFHAFGDYWGTSINNASLEITMPKNIEKNTVKFFGDKYRNNDITSYIDYSVVGNKIYAKVLPSMNLKKSLTIDIELPEGYFMSAKGNYGYLSLILCLIVIFFFVITLVKWIKYGKDNEKYSETVEFYSPEGYDSAEIGYIYKRDTGRKLAISIIVELASKGFIKIDESEDKKVRTITNLYPVDNNNSTNQITNKEFDSKHNMSSNEKLVYEQLFANGDTNILSDDKEFYQVFSKITENLQNELDDKINDVTSYKNMMITSFMYLIGTICFALSFTIFEDLNPKYKILYLIAFIALIVTFILVILMKRKNTYGEQIVAKVKGFKNYLETAEKDQIDNLVNDNPNYFYDILPYAYVLGVSKVWIDKFENIPIPQNDMGNFDYSNMDSFNSLSKSVYTPSSSGSSSGGCSSCGGGCSSCGGGGSW